MTQTRRRELMIEALEGDYAFEALKALIQGLLNEGIANEILLEDLAQIKGLLPGKLEEIIFFDHPSGYNRIRSAMVWKSQNLELFQSPAEKTAAH